MAGASKQRARKERKNGNGNETGDSNGKDKSSDSPETQQASSSSESPPQRHSPPSGWDGNRDPTTSAATPMGPTVAIQTTRNMDLGLRNSYLMHGGTLPTDLAPRPNSLNNTGRAIPVKLNTWNVTTTSLKTVYQYDVAIGSGDEKRGLIKRVWNSKGVKDAIGLGWIFDGNKIAYNTKDLTEQVRVEVDLDIEDGKPPRKDKEGNEKPNLHVFRLKRVKKVPVQSLEAYLTGQGSWDVNCLESMTMLDRLMRETPSHSLTSIKRNFYHKSQERTILGGAVEAMKGVYITIRPVLAALGKPATLSVNVDVANTTFWSASPLTVTAKDLIGARDIPTMVVQLRPQGNQREAPMYKMLHRLNRLRVMAVYNNPGKKDGAKDEFVIDKILPIRPMDKKFKTRDASGNEQTTNVQAYMTQKYGIRLQYPDLPLIKMTKGTDTCIPMEMLTVCPQQRYPFKLNERQTAEMIRFAVTVPQQRWRDIEGGVSILDWRSDKYLQNYGLQIGQPSKVQATLLPPPKVMFAQGCPPAEPKTSGRWDLRGKKFIEAHPGKLTSWGVSVIPGRNAPDKTTVQNFISTFVRTFKGHGGKIENERPTIIQGTADAGSTVEALWNAAGSQSNGAPQLLVFIVPDKSAPYYNRLKKSCDCRYGVVSQVLQSSHVQRAQAQYCSNVALKVNAKLGGCTARAQGVKSGPWFNKPTLIIGADVSHGAPGSPAVSIAAITLSWDRVGLRYAAAVETNGRRIEMISEDNWNKQFAPMLRQWVKTVGGGRFPEHIYYMRDGVSEGEYSQVLNKELKGIQNVVKELSATAKPLYTVMTCTKRHHIRFFPEGQAGDKNGNPQPGTLVEQGATDPRDYDFYLCAHSAIKGTARPVHYTVLRDDAKLSHMEMENMLYEASYQYVRATTPVSLHPAIYYAHLAALRANCHQNTPSEVGGGESRTGPSDPNEEIPLLMPMPNGRGIRGAMWYV